MSDQWFYAVGSEQRGPVPAGQLRQMLTSGQLQPDTLVWRDGLSDWAAASTVAELQDAPVAAAPSQLEPAPQPGPAWTPPAPQPQYGAVPPAGTPYISYQTPQEQAGGLAVTSMVLGIISIPGACLACIGLLLGILAIVFSLMNKSPAHASQAKAGLICGIIGIVLSLLSGVIGVIAQFG